MTSKTILKSLGALLLVASAGAVSAQTATLNYTGPDLRASLKYNSSGGTALSTYSQGALGLSDGSSSFWAYCIDPNTTAIFSPAQSYAVKSLDQYLDGTASSGYASQLTRPGSGYSGLGLSTNSATQTTVKDNLTELFSHAYADSLLNANNAAAFGMAAWEIIMQDSNGSGVFASGLGRVRTSGSDTTYSSGNDGIGAPAGDSIEKRTQQYLAALSNSSESTGWGNISLGTSTNWDYTVYVDLTSPFSQTFIRVTPGGGGNNQTPIPGTLALAGLGFFLTARFKQRGKQQSQA